MNRQSSRAVLYALASGFGLGFSPYAPGTVGSLGGIALFLLTRPMGGGWQALLFALFCLSAIGIADGAERVSGERDPSFIVIDEIAGMWAALLFLGREDMLVLALAFVLFRAFDIAKFFPLNLFESFRGGVGIVADDVAAGMLVNLLLRLLLTIGLF